MHFDAPAGTTLTGVRRNVHSATGAVVGGAAPWHWGYTETGVIVGQSTPIAINSSSGGEFEHTFDEPFPARLSRFGFELICSSGQGGDCLDNGSSFVVRRVALQVDDPTPPKIVQSSGSLLQTTGPQKGERHLALALRDVGGGLYMVRVDVDGEPMSQIPVDDNQGACRRPFLQPVPCKLAANVDVPVDTTQLTDGPHIIDVRVFDATGVNSAVVGPVSLLVDNEPDPLPRGTAGCPATNSAKLRRRSRPTVVRFGGSVLITGRVSGPRAVLRGARVGVVDNSSVAGPPSLAQLSGKGRFKIRVRP